ncbi:HAD-IA family hydrolase [Saccharomonospora saliphila]|uniref:HAD-IA family hydrolase n=1 Tax=Saccharomonospora saliphila TaxID=369829 RepID=UPI000382BA80|nr:HAD-IA family hydrolase [Saccharomonospora saliphila]
MLRGLILDYAGVLTDVDAVRLLSAVDGLRAVGGRSALVSNAASGGEVRARLTGRFDTLVFSGEVGCAKPDPEIYLMAARRLGLAPGDCVFVDDAYGNVAGAVATGMAGVHHVTVEETLGELSALLPGIDTGIA